MKLSRIDFWGVVFRIFTGAVFSLAGFSKLMEPVENFRGSIAEYQVVPYALVPVIAHVFPWLELIFGIFMLAGYLPRLAAAMACLFSSTFLFLFIASGMLFSESARHCGCFGQTGFIQLTVAQMTLLDLAILAAAVYLLRRPAFPLSLDAWLKRS